MSLQERYSPLHNNNNNIIDDNDITLTDVGEESFNKEEVAKKDGVVFVGQNDVVLIPRKRCRFTKSKLISIESSERSIELLDKRSDSDGEEPVVQPIPNMPIDDIVSVEDSDDSEGSEDSQCESDSDRSGDGLLDDDTRVVEMVVNSSDDDINVGSVKFTKYLEKHEYKLDADGIYRLRLGDMFRDVNHFRQVLHEEVGCPWFVKGARLKIRMVFGCKDIRKSMNGYEKLFQYAAAIHRAEPGAISKVPCIGIDGCHLKRKYSGVLLAIVASNANKGIVLLTLFWKAAKSSNKHDYKEAMAQIKEEKLAASNWLETELEGYT
ncbi:hypothetical protein WN943_001049 [Citrus x changshan-huyou]